MGSESLFEDGGTVERVTGGYVRVGWDHYGLALAQLGTMADLQRPEDLRKVDDDA